MSPGPGPLPQFSVYVFVALIAVAIASAGTFWWLCVRWTTRRRWSELVDWARGQGFAVRSAEGAGGAAADAAAIPLPPVLAPLASLGPTVRLSIGGDRQALVSLTTPTTPYSQAPNQPANWHVLLHRLEAAWPATALRPASNHVSLVDLMPLTSFPSLTTNERFVVFGTDARAAKQLAASSARALLPPDVGLLLVDDWLILDFSARPFDTIEFGRQLALADQVVSFLPAAGG